ncbi:MAG: Lrp/AsnC family transcriptional regulator [Pseudomonadota bacterium]
MSEFDQQDRRILKELQRDASQSVEDLAEAIGLSRNATWRRVKRLEELSVIRARVALLDPDRIGLNLVVFIAVKTDRHDAAWADDLARVVHDFPEIMGAYRIAGDIDYLLRARVADVKAYDDLYQRLIARFELKDVTASFVMEEIKETTELPLS